MMHTCAKCGTLGMQIWTRTRSGENDPILWICTTCRKEWLK